jgi:hypothetical protein
MVGNLKEKDVLTNEHFNLLETFNDSIIGIILILEIWYCKFYVWVFTFEKMNFTWDVPYFIKLHFFNNILLTF